MVPDIAPGMGIGEIARRARMRASAIRYYESLGLLPLPPRVGGKRRYGPEVLERLAMIRFVRTAGFRLGEVLSLLAGAGRRPAPERWRTMAAAKIGELDRSAARVRTMRRLLTQSLAHRCPRLAERGEALLSDPAPATSGRRRGRGRG